MPLGLTNAHPTFQHAMNDLFRPYLHHFILVFFYDILIYSRTWPNHLEHLDCVLYLRSHQFYAKPSKCAFGQSQIDYLDHVISAAGLTKNSGHSKLAPSGHTYSASQVPWAHRVLLTFHWRLRDHCGPFYRATQTRQF